MSTAMPPLESNRLIIRPFVLDDLATVHRVLSAAWDEPPDVDRQRIRKREHWLRWSVANYEELAALTQPPYGDRAMTLKGSGELIGSVGLVPSMGPFGQLPGFPANTGSTYLYPECGLYWAVDPAHQGKGYATEAARAVIDWCFSGLNLGRIVAMTEYDNIRSQSVMRKLGMTLLSNPLPEPVWFQVVGLLER